MPDRCNAQIVDESGTDYGQQWTAAVHRPGGRPPGDKIVIGSQELILLQGHQQSLRETVNFPGRGTLPRIAALPANAIQPFSRSSGSRGKSCSDHSHAACLLKVTW